MFIITFLIRTTVTLLVETIGGVRCFSNSPPEIKQSNIYKLLGLYGDIFCGDELFWRNRLACESIPQDKIYLHTNPINFL